MNVLHVKRNFYVFQPLAYGTKTLIPPRQISYIYWSHIASF
jgi:hypothetical protein